MRERIPGVVLRTSLITGLPYEDEAAFEELCDFLGEQKLQRVGAFPYSPEEGTPAARMLNRVDTEEAQRRAELVMEIQTQVMDEFNDSRMGDTVEVLCDGYDVQAMSYVGRSYAESPGIDGASSLRRSGMWSRRLCHGAYHRRHGRRPHRRSGGGTF